MRIATYDDMLQAFSDTFKEYHGCRPSYDYGSQFTYDELGEQIDMLNGWIAEDIQREADEDAHAMASVMAVGCPDEDTAQRWLDDAWEIY